MDAFIPTNTFASINFDVLKLDAPEDPLVDINRLATMDFEESYFGTAVKFICECNNEITDKKIAFYHALSEATTEVAVLESFADYFSGVRDIISKFLRFLKSLVDRFIISFNKLIHSDKYITAHIGELDGFKDEDDKFDFYGYNFTFSPMIPKAQAVLAFNAELFSDLPVDNGNLSISGVQQAIDGLAFGDAIDKFRGDLIGIEGRIFATEFQDELFAVYRDGDKNTVNISVDASYVRNASKRFKDYKEIKRTVEKQRVEVERVYSEVEKSVKNVVKANGGLNTQAFINNLPSDIGITSIGDAANANLGQNMTADMMAKIDVYIRKKTDLIQEYSNNHLMAFTAKLDAMKDCYIQDRNVLYTALSRVNKSGNARKEAKKK